MRRQPSSNVANLNDSVRLVETVKLRARGDRKQLPNCKCRAMDGDNEHCDAFNSFRSAWKFPVFRGIRTCVNYGLGAIVLQPCLYPSISHPFGL